jgi:hypothetical protein
MSGLKTAVHVVGTVNQRDDTDSSWTVEFAIPASEVPGATVPLENGVVWQANLFRFDWPKGQKRQNAAAFSPPIVPDFHALDRFGRVRFVENQMIPRLGKPGRGLIRSIKKPGPKQDNARLVPSSGIPPKPAKNDQKSNDSKK